MPNGGDGGWCLVVWQPVRDAGGNEQPAARARAKASSKVVLPDPGGPNSRVILHNQKNVL
uniref:Uncharacterized protein n=1 Tax=Oryza nivara TaxID=4536 RepID=A0A0E0H9C5_ORYNI